MKKNRFILFAIIFLLSIVFIPKNVYAATEYDFQFYDNISDLEQEEKQNIIDTILNNPKVNTIDLERAIIFDINDWDLQAPKETLEYTSQIRYVLVSVSPNASPKFNISAGKSFFMFYCAGVFIFDNNLNLLNEEPYYGYIRMYSLSQFVYYNPFLYSKFIEVPYTDGSSYSINFYQGSNLIKTLKYNESILELSEFSNPVIKYEINDIHEISKMILGEDIPEEFSFVYLVFDFLLVLSFVVVIVSPFVIISRILRWK